MSDLTINLNVGDVIAGHLEVKNIMEENELGATFLACDTFSHENILVKRLPFECTPDIESDIKDKIRTISRASHKSLAGVKEFVVSEGIGYILMDYLEGETLESHLKLRRERNQMLGLKAAYSFLSNLCLGTETLHRNDIYYGNLTPKTIIVTREGRVRISNYICTAVASQYLSDEAKTSYFNSKFIAPEVRENKQATSPASDIYSLSLLFAELLSNTSLSEFEGSPEAFIASLPGVSTTVKESLFQGTKPDIEDRFSNVQTFKDMLKNAMDAPNDNEISSIVMGVNDLRAMNNSSAEQPAIEAPARKADLFDSQVARPATRQVHSDVWIYQKDGMDFGPFDHEGLINKFYEDIINESTSVFNTSTKKRQNLGSIEEFKKEIIEYLPIRDHNRAQKAADEKKKKTRAATFGITTILTIVGVIAGMIFIPLIIFMMKPAPEPLAVEEAIPTFAKEFKLPKMDAVALNVDDSKAKALFDPSATEAEREAALRAWEEEHRRKYAGRKRGGAKKIGAPGEQIDTLVFTGEDGEELEPLADWEIEEVAMSPRMLRKVQDCYAKHAGGRRPSITLKFNIQQTGAVRNISTTASGELDSCIVSAFSSMSFRAFGGTVKKVSIPIG